MWRRMRKPAVLVVVVGLLVGFADLSQAAFVDNGNGTVNDTRTGLMWQQADDEQGRYWEEALAYCEGLSLGGRSDWRLPNIRELESIVDDDRYNPAIDPVFSCRSDSYWSGSTYADFPNYAWGVYFNYGLVDAYNKSYNSMYVRCVRGGPGYFAPLSIAQTPMSGPPGTTFVQWGTGFSANSTATLHFRKPDGTEYPTVDIATDSGGHFETSYTAPPDKPVGTYTWWAIDHSTGGKSNEVSYEIRRVAPFFLFSQIPSSVKANGAFAVAVTARLTGGGLDTAFNGWVALSSPVPVTPNSIQLTDGKWTGTVTVLEEGTNLALNAAGGGRSGMSNTFSTDGGSNGSIGGEVRDNRDWRLSLAKVYLSRTLNGEPAYPPVWTNSSGRYWFGSVASGTYYLWATYNDAVSPKDTTVVVPAGRTAAPDTLVVPVHTSSHIPVVLVPGIMGSTNKYRADWHSIVPKLTQSYESRTSLQLHDPDKKAGWRDLKKILHDPKGLEEGSTIIDCPWDWRMPLKQAVDAYLIPAIEEAKNKGKSEKVNIIAHSMGGLLVRSYIQGSSYENDIASFLMVGTPNKGSANAYYIWEGGDPLKADNLTDGRLDFFVNFYWNTTEDLYENAYRLGGLDSDDTEKIRPFVMDHVTTVRQLLPTYAFLRENGQKKAITDGGNKNDFLRLLNSDPNRFERMGPPSDPDRVKTTVFYSGSKSTIGTIDVRTGYTFWQGFYEDGRPYKDPVMIPGDGTVPENSAKLPYSEGWADCTYITGSHSSLIGENKDKIADALYQDTAHSPSSAEAGSTAADVTRSFRIGFTGRLQPLVTDPKGRTVGINQSTGKVENTIPGAHLAIDAGGGNISIDNPVNGSYTVSLSDLYNEDYGLAIGYMDSLKAVEKKYRGFMHAAQTTFTVRVAAGSASRIVVTAPPTPPSGLVCSAFIRSGLKTRLRWRPSKSTGVTTYNIYSKEGDQPFLTFVGTTSGTVFDTNDPWAAGPSVKARIYAVSTVQGDGAESFLSNHAMNNDRDHDSLTDEEEKKYGTALNRADTDGDGLKDGEEFRQGTNPLKVDTDGDGYSDLAEIKAGSDPLDPESVPQT